MKLIGRFHLGLVLLLVAMAAQFLSLGCKDFFTDRATTTTASSSSEFAYVSNFNGQPNQNGGPGTISTYTLNTSTGALGSGTLVSTGAATDSTSFGPAALTTANSGSFLYSANDGGGVSAFTVNATTGALTAVSGSPFQTGLGVPTALARDPSSKFLYVTDSSGVAGVAAFSINSSTGALTVISGSPFSIFGFSAAGITVHPNGKFVYVALGSSGTGIFTIGANGALSNFTVRPPFPGGQPQAVAITPSGTLAYVANGTSGVEQYSVNTGTGVLTPIGTLATGNNPVAITTDSSGKFVYVVNRDDTTAANNIITALAIQSDGSLAQITDGVLNVGSPSSVALDTSGKFVYVTNFNGSTVSIFSINSSTGQLTSAGSATTGANPSSIAFR